MLRMTLPFGVSKLARTAPASTAEGGAGSPSRKGPAGSSGVSSVMAKGGPPVATSGAKGRGPIGTPPPPTASEELPRPEPKDALGLANLVAESRPLTLLPDRRSRTGAGTRRRVRNVVLATLAAHQDQLPQHSKGVAALAGAVARRFGLRSGEVREVVHTAELHDVGKLALPEALLDKAGPLDEEEWELMRLHTLAGEQILADLPGVAEIGRLVRSTHERWDGLGYPDGLAGEEIPLASRVVFACDAYDAMTSARPYQRPKTSAEALEELEQCAATQFDPRVVSALIDELGSSRREGRG